MTLLDKLTYVITKLQEENYPKLNTYSLYKDSKYIATITKENEDKCLVYNLYMNMKPNDVKVLEPLSYDFVIVFSKDIMYFVTF